MKYLILCLMFFPNIFFSQNIDVEKDDFNGSKTISTKIDFLEFYKVVEKTGESNIVWIYNDNLTIQNGVELKFSNDSTIFYDKQVLSKYSSNGLYFYSSIVMVDNALYNFMTNFRIEKIRLCKLFAIDIDKEEYKNFQKIKIPVSNDFINRISYFGRQQLDARNVQAG